MIRALLAAVALTCAAVAAPAAFAQAPANVLAHSANNLSGQWQGAYCQADTCVPFHVELRHQGQRVTGAMTEVNSFGSQDTMFLLSDISGQRNGARISFDKTYNGVGGQSHTVRYIGTISSDGRRITGTWSIPGASDRFEMVR